MWTCPLRRWSVQAPGGEEAILGEPRLRAAAAMCCALVCSSAWVADAGAQEFAGLHSLSTFSGLLARGQDEELLDSPEGADSPFEHHLETDRDSFTPATTTVDRGRWIVESSYSFIDNRRAPDTNSFPELIVRYGLGERFELRLGWNYEAGGGGNVVSSVEGEEGLEGPRFERESRALYGFKWRATDQAGWVPQSSFIVQGYTPTTGDATATEGSVTYVWGWELPKKWKLDAALRYASSTDHRDDFAIWNPSAVVRIPLGERANVHAEYFGAIPYGRAGGQSQHFASTGLHYLLTPDVELGFRIGWGLNDAAANFFSNVGIGWRY